MAGGGTALVHAWAAIKDLQGINHCQTVGVNILRRAMEDPLNQIDSNAGDLYSTKFKKVLVRLIQSGHLL